MTPRNGEFMTRLEAERSALLRNIASRLQQDERVAAAWLTGSMGRRESDSLSDLDLGVAIEDAHCLKVISRRREFVMQFGTPILIQEAPQNAPRDGAFLLVLYRGDAAPQEVDWFWQPVSSARIPESAHVLFDRAGLPHQAAWLALNPEEAEKRISFRTTFFWAMAEVLPPTEPRAQMDYLRELLTQVGTTDGPGGLVSLDAIDAITRFVETLDDVLW